MKLSKNPTKIAAKLEDRLHMFRGKSPSSHCKCARTCIDSVIDSTHLQDGDELSLERDKNNIVRIVEEKKDSPPMPTAYLALGVMIALLVFLMLVKHVPGLLPMLTSLFPKPTNTVTNSTTFGTFSDASDLYTARIYECDVLDYTKKERQMTLILRYHVNALYDMSKIQMKISNRETDPSSTGVGTVLIPEQNDVSHNDANASKKVAITKSNEPLAADSSPKAISENSTASAIKGPTITIHLPVEKIEVILDKYAGMTGKIQEGDLPGIEVFGFKGNFNSEEDDLIAQAFLTLFENDITYVAPVPNMSQNLNELEDPSANYLDNIRVLVDNNFVDNIGTIVNEKRGRLIIGAQKSVASSLVTYYNALGFSSVEVIDANGVSLINDEEVIR